MPNDWERQLRRELGDAKEQIQRDSERILRMKQVLQRAERFVPMMRPETCMESDRRELIVAIQWALKGLTQ